MGSTKSDMSTKMLWMTLAVTVTSILAFTGGYFVGALTNETSKAFTIVDDYGRAVTIDGIPQRIVSVAPTPTEIIFAVGAGGQVVGVDDYSDYPAEAANLSKVGSYTLNIEAIVALQPDLFKTIRLAGVITGHVSEADSLASALSERVDAVKAKTLAPNVTTPKVYVEYYPMWTYGPGSFGDDLISIAGGINVAHNASSEYPEVTNEYIIAQNPEVIVYTTGVMSTTTKYSIVTRPGWENISAVETDHIYSIDDNLLSRYGPRIVDGLEQLAAIIHPELFG